MTGQRYSMRSPRTMLLSGAAPCFYPDEAPAVAPASTLYPVVDAPAAPAAPAPDPAAPATETPAPAGEVSLGDPPAPKPEGEAPAGEKPKEAPTEGGDPAPIEVKIPDGVEFKPEALESFKTLAAEAGIKSEGAQKLLDLYIGEMQGQATAQAQAWTDTISGWKTELNALPDFATAEQRTANQVILGRALDEYGTPEARAAFDLTGAGWNPHIVQTFFNMAKALGEGGPTLPGAPAGQATTRSQRLYNS